VEGHNQINVNGRPCSGGTNQSTSDNADSGKLIGKGGAVKAYHGGPQPEYVNPIAEG